MGTILQIRKVTLLLCTLAVSSALASIQPSFYRSSAEVLPGIVVVKFRSSEARRTFPSEGSLVEAFRRSPLFSQFTNASLQKTFPEISPSEVEKALGIDRIFYFRFSYAVDPFVAADSVRRSPFVEYAEPHFIYRLDSNPNDPLFIQQSYLKQINADTAWTISSGSPDILIGIVDTGIEWTHPDLFANISVNPGEDINHNGRFDNYPVSEIRNGVTGDIDGVDNDANGYSDDVIGWDFAGATGEKGDNNPAPGNPHGTHVAGIASAVTNNNTGIAGVGNRCKLLAIKAGVDNPQAASILFGYEGIKYAADRRADVINCSWGGDGGSLFAEDIIKYATAKGSLVVAAAGNENFHGFHFPSDYPDVLSVTSVSPNDTRSSFSNYNLFVDVSAPGENILSTVTNSAYGTSTGTSMSTPMAAGIAGLLKALHPSWNAGQVREQIRESSVNIDARNPSYEHKIGFGRLDALRALTVQTPGVHLESFLVSDSAYGNNDGTIDPAESLQVLCTFRNYLAPAGAPRAELTTSDPYVILDDSVSLLAPLATLEQRDNSARPFLFHLKPFVPDNHLIFFLIKITDSNYSDYNGFTILAKPTFRDNDAGVVALTVNTRGNLGFDDYPYNTAGKGFLDTRTGLNLLFEGALMAGLNETRVVDVARNDSMGSQQNRDFAPLLPLNTFRSTGAADKEIIGLFGDSAVGQKRIGLQIQSRSLSFASPPLENTVMIRYRVVNTSGKEIDGLYCGTFFDWDIGDAYSNIAGFDSTRRLGFVYDSSRNDTTLAGVSLLSRNGNLQFHAINNKGDETWGIYDGFSKSEKWQAMTGGISKTSASGDVSFVIGAGPFSLGAGDSIILGIAVIASPTIANLQSSAESAQGKWNELKLDSVRASPPATVYTYQLYQNFPNPFNSGTAVAYSLQRESKVTLSIFDILGRDVTSRVLGSRSIPSGAIESIGSHEIDLDFRNLASGVYFYRLKAGTGGRVDFVETKKCVLVR